MRLFSSTVRVLMKAGSLVAPWLLLVSTASAAPVFPSRPAGSPSVCDPRGSFGRPMSLGGPVARPSGPALAGLIDVTSLLRRSGAATLDEGDAVIQNAPAARIDADERLTPLLEPLETLACSRQALPRHRAFSRRSPRGPPIVG